MTVEGNVFVHRNVKASAINGIDFGNLFEKVAKKSNPFNHFKGKCLNFHINLVQNYLLLHIELR